MLQCPAHRAAGQGVNGSREELGRLPEDFYVPQGFPRTREGAKLGRLLLWNSEIRLTGGGQVRSGALGPRQGME